MVFPSNFGHQIPCVSKVFEKQIKLRIPAKVVETMLTVGRGFTFGKAPLTTTARSTGRITSRPLPLTLPDPAIGICEAPHKAAHIGGLPLLFRTIDRAKYSF
jgi:hypothetical protein